MLAGPMPGLIALIAFNSIVEMMALHELKRRRCGGAPANSAGAGDSQGIFRRCTVRLRARRTEIGLVSLQDEGRGPSKRR